MRIADIVEDVVPFPNSAPPRVQNAPPNTVAPTNLVTYRASEPTDVRAELAREFWYRVQGGTKHEVWRHRDDPDLGECWLYLTPSGRIKKIDHAAGGKIMHFLPHQFEQFLQHLHAITADPRPGAGRR